MYWWFYLNDTVASAFDMRSYCYYSAIFLWWGWLVSFRKYYLRPHNAGCISQYLNNSNFCDSNQ